MTDANELMADLDDVLGQHLPKMQVEWLRERLEVCDDLEERVARLTAANEELIEQVDVQNTALREANRQIDDFARRDADLAAAEAGVEERNRTLELAQAVAAERMRAAEQQVDLMRGVVSDVFSNNRFKYERTAPVVVDSGGYADSSNYGQPSVVVPSGSHVEHHKETVQGEQ